MWQVGRYPVDKHFPGVKFYFAEEPDWTRDRTCGLCIVGRSPRQQLWIFKASWHPLMLGLLGYLCSRTICFLLCPGRPQQLPLASILIFILENRQRWHFPPWWWGSWWRAQGQKAFSAWWGTAACNSAMIKVSGYCSFVLYADCKRLMQGDLSSVGFAWQRMRL